MTLQKLGGSFFNIDKGTYLWTAGTRGASKGAGSVGKSGSSSNSSSSSSKSKSTNTGSGSKSNPYKASQPDKSKVSSTISNYSNQSPGVSSPTSSSNSSGGRSPGATTPHESKTTTTVKNTNDVGSTTNPIKSEQPDQTLVSPVLKSAEGTTTNPIKSEQPDYSKVSPVVRPENREGSYVGYDNYGRALQGAPAPTSPQQYTVDIGRTQTTTLPTMGGGTYEAQAKDPLVFDSKEEAEKYVEAQYTALPLPLQRIPGVAQYVTMTDDSAKSWKKDADKNPDDFNTQLQAAGISIQAGMINTVQSLGELVDKHILKQESVPVRPVTIASETWYDKGMEKSFENVKITDDGITGLELNPTVPGNVLSKFGEGAVTQWEKQTPAENIAQSVAIAPLVAFDILTAGQAGTAIIRTVPVIASKIMASPTTTKLLLKATGDKLTKIVMEASQPTPKINTSPYATADMFPSKQNIVLTTDEIIQSLTPKKGGGLNQGGVSQGDVGIVKGIEKPPVVKEDPTFKPTNRANEIDYSDAGDFSSSRYPPSTDKEFLNLQKDLGDIAHGRTTFTKDTINLGEEISNIQRIPNRTPTTNIHKYLSSEQNPPIQTPKTGTAPISKIPRYTDIDSPILPKTGTAPRLQLPKINQPNYDRAASDFVDFQASLNKTPGIYDQVFTTQRVQLTDKYNPGIIKSQKPKGVGEYGAERFRLFQEYVSPPIPIKGTIKFSEGFTPNKYPTQIIRSKTLPKEIETDPWYKPEKITNDMLTDTGKGGQPVSTNITPPSKIVHIPKGGTAPITKNPRYTDIDNPKLPKGGHAPIGWVKTKTTARPNLDNTIKSTAPPRLILEKPKDVPSTGKETGQDGSVTILKEVNKLDRKKQLPSQNPPDNWVEITYDQPMTSPPSPKGNTLLPPIITIKEKEKEKILPRQNILSRTIPQSITKPSLIRSIVNPQITSQPQKLSQSSKTTQIIKQSQTPIQKTSTIQSVAEAVPKNPKTTHKPKFRTRSKQIQIIGTATPRNPRIIAAAIFVPKTKKTAKQTSSKSGKGKDFLGAMRTYHIVGQFKRDDIIYGDKKTAKQLTKDLKFKEEEKKRKKYKKKKKSFLQNQGIVNKKYKII